MRWLVTGGNGMLGQDAVRILSEWGHEAVAPDRAELDITNAEAAFNAARSVDVVLNCAGWTAVDAAEDCEERAFAANALGAANLARGAHAADVRLVHMSTDYVFDGTARAPYDEDSPLSPCSAYGRTKAAGEWAVRAAHPGALAVRTAWLYGAHGRCFPKAIASRAATGQHLTVVDDQWGQPTWTADVVDLIARLVAVDAPAGIYHATSSGSTTWYAFAEEVVDAAGLVDIDIRPVTSGDYPQRARRPAYSVLAHGALEELGLAPIGDWRHRWRLAAGIVLG